MIFKLLLFNRVNYQTHHSTRQKISTSSVIFMGSQVLLNSITDIKLITAIKKINGSREGMTDGRNV